MESIRDQQESLAKLHFDLGGKQDMSGKQDIGLTEEGKFGKHQYFHLHNSVISWQQTRLCSSAEQYENTTCLLTSILVVAYLWSTCFRHPHSQREHGPVDDPPGASVGVHRQAGPCQDAPGRRRRRWGSAAAGPGPVAHLPPTLHLSRQG